jgi:pimeloyl-ACP methyl ester carboxylesterase
MIERDLRLPGGGTLHAYDTGATATTRVTFVWHHGTPNLGVPPAPLTEVSARLGIRWLSYDRPGYGRSTPQPGRDVAAAAGWAAVVADAAGVDSFAVVGHSGGGPHALACAALRPDRVLGLVTLAGLAPFGAAGLDWFDGMYPSSAASLRAARQGRAAKEAYEANAGFDAEMFTAADHAALDGDWTWLNEVVGPALANGPGALIDDDLAYVHPWGFEPAPLACPALLVHGRADRIVPVAHSRWLAAATGAEAWLDSADGHVSVLRRAADALSWLVDRL